VSVIHFYFAAKVVDPLIIAFVFELAEDAAEVRGPKVRD
jgi:hypothetical protein